MIEALLLASACGMVAAKRSRYQHLSTSAAEHATAGEHALQQLCASMLLQSESFTASEPAQSQKQQVACFEVMQQQHDEAAHSAMMSNSTTALSSPAAAVSQGTTLTAAQLLQKLPFLAVGSAAKELNSWVPAEQQAAAKQTVVNPYSTSKRSFHSVSSMTAAPSPDVIDLTSSVESSDSAAAKSAKKTYRDMTAANDATTAYDVDNDGCITNVSNDTELDLNLIPTLVQWNSEQKGCSKAYAAGLIEQRGTANSTVVSIPDTIDVLCHNPGYLIEHNNVFPVQEMVSRAVHTMQQLLKLSTVNDKPHFVILH